MVTADGDTIRATADEHPDLYFGLRGGGGNFGIVTEFEFRLHPISHTVLAVDRYFEPADAPAALRAWRDLLPDAPRQATLTADANTAAPDSDLPERLHGRPVVSVGFIWVGDVDDGRRYLDAFRETGAAVAETCDRDALRRAPGHRRRVPSPRQAALHEGPLPDRAVGWRDRRVHRPRCGGRCASRIGRGCRTAASRPTAARSGRSPTTTRRSAIAAPSSNGAARRTGSTRPRTRSASPRHARTARRWSRSRRGVYVNVLTDEGEAGVRRAYNDAKLARLAEVKRRYDPDNVFHLNTNIRPAAAPDPA